jgi:succinate dehydrogenase/fumarate reductase cytochrome b subunit
MKKFTKISAIVLAAAPIFALAANTNFSYLTTALNTLKELIDSTVVLLVSVAVVYFIWNVIRYVIAGEEDKKEAAKTHMVWGIVAIAVIVSVWGLVALLQNVFLGSEGVQGVNGLDKLIPKK